MKSLIEFFRTMLFTKPGRSSGPIWVYVRCNRCGEALKTQIDLQHDLSVEYGPRPRSDRFHTRKTLTGSNLCFQRIDARIYFDAHKNIVDEQIEGGTRISKQEFNKIIASSR